jgi:hypothetical protein
MADPFDPPQVHCRHLLVCRTIWQNPADPDEGYSLGRVVIHVRPPAGDGYGFTIPRLFAYAELFGTPDEYTIRIELAAITATADGDEDAAFVRVWGPWDVAISGDGLVEPFGIPLPAVEFPDPGVYEFTLWVDGFEEPVGRERVEARE